MNFRLMHTPEARRKNLKSSSGCRTKRVFSLSQLNLKYNSLLVGDVFPCGGDTIIVIAHLSNNHLGSACSPSNTVYLPNIL